VGDWLGEHAWAVWFLVAVLLGVVEVTTLDLTFAMLAVGALAAAGVSAAGAPFLLAVAVSLAVSVGMLAVVRPVALRHLRAGAPELRTGVAALVGRQAVTLARVDGHSGQIKLAGEVWSARCYDPQQVIEPGSTVDVVQIDGATAVVFPATQ
jgi:membrane protein implicated in regulation of membrane protease activity